MAMKLQNENLTRREMDQENYEAFFFDNYYEKDVPLHCHNDFFEIYFFLSGDLRYLMESTAYKMVPGTVLLIPPGTFHQPVFLSKDAPYTRMFLWLSRSYLMRLSSRDTNLCSCFEEPGYKKIARMDPDDMQRIQSAFLKLTRLKGSGVWGADLLANSIITDILLTVHGVCQERRFDPADIHQDTFLSLVTAYISDNIEEIQTLDQVAEHFYINKAYLSRQFTKKLGVSAYQYIIKKRMAYAYQLLQEGHPLSAICTSAGYKDYPTFYKAFRKEYGNSPTLLAKAAEEKGPSGL